MCLSMHCQNFKHTFFVLCRHQEPAQALLCHCWSLLLRLLFLAHVQVSLHRAAACLLLHMPARMSMSLPRTCLCLVQPLQALSGHLVLHRQCIECHDPYVACALNIIKAEGHSPHWPMLLSLHEQLLYTIRSNQQEICCLSTH